LDRGAPSRPPALSLDCASQRPISDESVQAPPRPGRRCHDRGERMSELVITHETRPSPAMHFLVNFGLFAGREATRLEMERLAKRLLRTLATVTVCAERRLEASRHSLAELHQVRVEIDRELRRAKKTWSVCA